ncbi:MAG TPA: nickel pincer cofactor biosynthesis protein LarC [Thermomicrobiales bacterium]|nr:nickel pincer cofactor biosynthesis protein LarC [Thermomicrobiales bacterium]
MRVILFDPFSGASGDMILGALLDLGLDANRLRAELARLPLDPFDLEIEPANRHGLTGTRCRVVVHEERHPRNWAAIRDLLSAASLPPAARSQALAVFGRLAEAEAAVHGTTVEEVHFHEVGGTDAVVDIVGACLGLSLLGVERVFSAPPSLGSGWIQAAHGPLPVPAPAVAELLARAAAPVAALAPLQAGISGELLTPTGAAILTVLAEFRRPGFSPSAVGYGFGEKEFPWPNALRAWLGEMAADDVVADELLLETNIDDMNPQFTELLVERLFAAGALDAWLTPVVMKKGRVGVTVSVLSPAERRRDLEDVLIEQTTTLGVRSRPVDRVKAARRFETVTTRWGDVRVKLRGWRGRVIDAAPEYDDCLELARSADVPIREVWNEAHRMGEVFIGQRWSPDRTPSLRVVPPPPPVPIDER